MPHNHVIVWDLDDTLGSFKALERCGDDPSTAAIRLRPGIAAALEALAQAGFVHSLLTLATARYAEVALQTAGLRDWFARVEGLGQRGKGDAAGLAEVFGIPESERPHRLLFVGDHPLFDAPQDARVLFHLECCALERPATALTGLVLTLRDQGNGSLRRGFERIAYGQRGWQRAAFWRRGKRIPRPRRVGLPGVGDLVVADPPAGCPIIAFADAPQTPVSCEP